MSKLQQIKSAQIEQALASGEPNPYETGVRPTGSNKPVGRMARIKAKQLADADKTGVNPYDRAAESVTQAAAKPGDLSHYQAAMQVDIAKVSAQKDIANKLRVKQTLLPTYMGFVDEYVSSGDNYPNDVAVQVMIWLLDIGEIEHGLNLSLHLVKQGQRMPAKFDRDMQTFLCDFFYDWANALLKEEHSASPYLDTLIATAENDHWDVHPLCLSKLYVMLAKHKERSGDYREALALCEKAEAVNPEKAGVKGLKERLKKQLNT